MTPCARPDRGNTAVRTPGHRTAGAPHDAPLEMTFPATSALRRASPGGRETPRRRRPEARRPFGADTRTDDRALHTFENGRNRLRVSPPVRGIRPQPLSSVRGELVEAGA